MRDKNTLGEETFIDLRGIDYVCTKFQPPRRLSGVKSLVECLGTRCPYLKVWRPAPPLLKKEGP